MEPSSIVEHNISAATYNSDCAKKNLTEPQNFSTDVMHV